MELNNCETGTEVHTCMLTVRQELKWTNQKRHSQYKKHVTLNIHCNFLINTTLWEVAGYHSGEYQGYNNPGHDGV